MKKMFKDLKKGGFAGAKARKRVKFALFGFSIMAVIATLCFMSGGLGCIAGATMASLFVLPTGLDLSEKEKKGLNALADHFNSQFQEFSNGKMSEADMISKMSEKLKSWSEENGFSKEKFEQMNTALKEQGKMLNSLKEQATLPQKATGGLKAAFEKNYDALANAVKERKSNFVIKAVDEHTEGRIQTTANSISTTSGAILTDSIGYNDELFMKRRGREYIHDIANVTPVDEVPETFVFNEEGAEDGSIAIVAENGLKPQIHLSLVRNQVNAKKAAGYIVVTEEMMKWRTRIWAQIQRLFSDKVWRDYEKLLTEDLLTNAVAYTSTALDDTIADPSDFDAIIAAVLQLEALEYQPDVLVINPADKWKLALAESKNGAFILPYIQQGGEFSLLGLRVITSNKIDAGTFVIGESGTWFIEEEPVRLRTGLVNDDFIHNRMTIIGELFFLSYVPSNNAGSFVKGSFSTIKEALKSSGSAAA